MAAILKGTGIYAVSDEVYRDLYFTRDRPGSISEYYENTLVAGGLSKIMSMTGWRLGWLLGRSEVLATALVLHGYNTVCASTISQKAALAFWTPDGERAKTDAREIYRKRRDLLMGLIETELQMNAVAPDGAFYAMLDVSELGDEMEIVEWLLRNRVITINGSAFGSEAKGFLRISFCTTEENIREGINRMKQVLRG
jgi:aspartate/methionine/tyrosine aminotransferase